MFKKTPDCEKVLVEELLGKSQFTLKKFFGKFKQPLFFFLLKRVDNEEDAKDILQETFISALRALPGFEFRCPLFSWLCAIAKHETIDFYRKKKLKTVLASRVPFFEEIADQALGPEGKHLKQELKQEIKNVLCQLSEGYSKILRLKYVDGLSMKTIAQILEITVKAVESKLGRAKNKFKELWQRKESAVLAKEYLRSPP
ncbi:MAG: RNA polymerase sigma factor [Patescibacteria group bacterium]|nr:RNA polymerase sigma factor [Patescibacteria group bacterium]